MALVKWSALIPVAGAWTLDQFLLLMLVRLLALKTVVFAADGIIYNTLMTTPVWLGEPSSGVCLRLAPCRAADVQTVYRTSWRPQWACVWAVPAECRSCFFCQLAQRYDKGSALPFSSCTRLLNDASSKWRFFNNKIIVELLHDSVVNLRVVIKLSQT